MTPYSQAITTPVARHCRHCSHFRTGRYEPPLGECDRVIFEVDRKWAPYQDETIEVRYRVQHAASRPTHFGCVEFQPATGDGIRRPQIFDLTPDMGKPGSERTQGAATTPTAATVPSPNY